MRARPIALLLAAMTVVPALPAVAGDSTSVRVRLGLFDPAADSSYWDEITTDFTGTGDDFKDVTIGFDYLWWTSPHSGVMVTLDHWRGEASQAYRDYFDAGGRAIVHGTTLETSGVGVAWVVDLIGRPAPITPYLGIGGGLLSWRLEEAGRFVDFSAPDPEVFSDRFRNEGTTFAWYALAGIEVGLSPTWSLVLEGRWRSAEDDLSGDFADLASLGYGKLDLSGTEITGGFAVRF